MPPLARSYTSCVRKLGRYRSGTCGGPDDGLCRRRRASHFLLRRCTRVFRSSLRCFFLAILLRRFLMTEPTTPPSLDDLGTTRHARARPTPAGWGHTPTLFYTPTA